MIENDENDEMNEMNHDMKTLIVDVSFFEAFDTTTFDDEAFITLFEMMKDVVEGWNECQMTVKRRLDKQSQ